MKIISVENDFNLIEVGIDKVICKSNRLPLNVFGDEFKYFLFITFDELCMAVFFNRIKQYLTEIGEENFWVVVTDPDPRTYFENFFGIYGAFEFSSLDDEKEYLSGLNDYPKDSPADALAHNSNSLLIFSSSGQWAIFGNRDADIAICAFVDRETREIFRLIYGTDLLHDLATAGTYAYGAPAEKFLKQVFCESYSDKSAD